MSVSREAGEEQRQQLEEALERIAGKAAEQDTDLTAFLMALHGLVTGRETTELAVGIEPPYRERFDAVVQAIQAGETGEAAGSA